MRNISKLSWALAASLLCSHSYSFETVYGQSNVNARNWVMQNVLPQQAGLTISHIVYEYGVIKETQDAMLVHVQNEDAINGGYIFRSTDDFPPMSTSIIGHGKVHRLVRLSILSNSFDIRNSLPSLRII